MSPAICQPLPRPLFPALSARVLKESLGVVSVTLLFALLALSLIYWAAPEAIQEATPRLPVYALFP